MIVLAPPGGDMHRAMIRFRIDFGTVCSIGPGKVALLRAIERTGSLSQAARDLGMSYRFAWALLDDLNRSFRQPVTVASVGGREGGGAQLTDFGRALIDAFAQFERASSQLAEDTFASISSKVATRPASAGVHRPLSQRRRAVRRPA
jgi:molybdate transport system regulatory protein